MKYPFALNEYRLDRVALVKEGFRETASGEYKKSYPLLEKDLTANYTISPSYISLTIFDEAFQEEFTQWKIEGLHGEFIEGIRNEVDEIGKRILTTCCVKDTFKETLIEYAKKKYGVEPFCPFMDDKVTFVFNHPHTHVWFALYMEISGKKLGQREQTVSVLNLKEDPLKIPSIIDKIHYFPAYHMNKKYWISVLLDKTLPLEELESLLDESYALTSPKRPKLSTK